MKLILLAMLMATGVFFGILALVVDLGYGMGQQGTLQNAADAGSMAAAKLLADSVASTSPISFVVTDDEVFAKASDFASANHAAASETQSFPLAVEYLPWTGSDCGTKNADGSNYLSGSYSHNSDANLVTALGGTRLPTGSSVPSTTCAIRVVAKESHSALFARANGTSTEQELAMAAARIYPTTPPTDVSDLWPVTQWISPTTDLSTLTNCTSGACTFWSSQFDAGKGSGKYKGLVDLSKDSSLFPSQLQIFNCLGGSCWDPARPGHMTDGDLGIPGWLANGWHGRAHIDEGDANCMDPSKIHSSCGNARPELGNNTWNGTRATQVADGMTAYVTNHPDCAGCTHATIAVFFWSYGEIYDSKTGAWTIWDGGSSNANAVDDSGRIFMRAARRFRFELDDIKSSGGNVSVKGYYVSFYNPDIEDATNGPPSSVANAVALVD